MSQHLTRDELERERRKHTLERDVQKDVCAYLLESHRPLSVTDASASYNGRGHRVIRVKENWPDVITVTRGGRLFAVEVKRPAGGTFTQPPPLISGKVKDRVSKLKGLGNAIVPTVAYGIFRAIEAADRQ